MDHPRESLQRKCGDPKSLTPEQIVMIREHLDLDQVPIMASMKAKGESIKIHLHHQ